MAITPITGVCSTDCDTALVFGAIAADQNCTPATYLSQIHDLFIKPNAATPVPFTGWTGSGATVTATASSIDNTLGDGTKCLHLIGIGSVDAPEKQTIILPKFAQKTTLRTYSLAFQFTNLEDENYDLLRQFQCSPNNFTFWYGTSDHAFGVATGLIPTFSDVDFVYATGQESIVGATLTVQWQAAIDPERVNNPYA